MNLRNTPTLIGLSLILVLGWPTVAKAQTPPPEPMPRPSKEPVKRHRVDAPADSKARIELSPPIMDFGEVWQATDVTTQFTVKNVGEEPLKVKVQTTCGCTVATQPKSPVLPGESTTFKVGYDTQRYLGPAKKTLIVHTNDPTNSRMEVDIRGDVKPVYKFTPSQRILMQGIDKDTIRTEKIEMANQLDRPVKLKLKDQQNFGGFDVEFREIEEGKKYELLATTVPPNPLGWTRGMVVLETDLDHMPQITIPMGAYMQPRVLASPFRIHLRPDSTEPSEHVVRVQYQAEYPMELKEARTNIEGATCEILPSNPTRKGQRFAMHRVRVTLPAWDQIPDQGALIEILTTDEDPDYQRLTVPVTAGETVPTLSRGGKGGIVGAPQPVKGITNRIRRPKKNAQPMPVDRPAASQPIDSE